MKLFKILPLIITALLVMALASCDMFGYPELPDPNSGNAGSSTSNNSGENGGNQNGGSIIPHTCQYGAWTNTKEADCKTAGHRTRCCIICGDSESEIIPKKDHTPEELPMLAPTCEEDGLTVGSRCKVCETVLTEQETVPATGHTEEDIPATENATAGVRCSVCGDVLIKPEWKIDSVYTSPEDYDSDYGYNYLATMPDGAKLQTLYSRIDTEADKFHLGDISADADGVIAEIAYSDLGLTLDEALSVWSVYRADRPLYYWFSGGLMHTDEEIHIKTDTPYIDTATRIAYNAKIYKAVEDYMLLVGKESTRYGVTLSLHDAIIFDTYYAYESDGVTPEDEEWAHNILGVLDLGAGVCESYAKTFQLLLNFAGIENVYVTGTSRNEAHAWNLVQMDDGKWYWFDLTWDDTPAWLWGISYNYFCVSNCDNTNWNDGAGNTAFTSTLFLENHTPTLPDVIDGVNFLYALPEASDTAYSSDSAMMRTTVFTVGDFTYTIVGDETVGLIDISAEGDIVIPSEVAYNGEIYKVITVGRLDDNGLFQSDCLTGDPYQEITSVFIPDSVQYVWYATFNFLYLEEITVDENNAAYASDNGILYSHDYTALQWIPQSIKGDVVIRDEMTNYSHIRFQYAPNVISVTLPSGIDEISAFMFNGCDNLVTVYYDGTVDEWESLTKGENWSLDSSFVVMCNDGKVNIY